MIEAFINETLIVTKVKVRLGSVIGDEYFAVLNRIHRARIDVEIRIKLLHGDIISTRL